MATTTTNNRTWIWYLVIVAGLTLAFIATLIVFNLRQQLGQPELDAAEALWQARKPPSYAMVLNKRINERLETFAIEVRNGSVVSVKLDGRELEQRQYIYYSMEALFDYVRRFLEIDSEPGKRRPYVIASFDEDDGHLIRYIRSDGATHQRVELHVQSLTPRP